MEPSVEYTNNGVERRPGDLIEQLSGHWLVGIRIEGDCPAEWRAEFPTGQTHWRDAGSHLSIEASEGSGPIELWPRNTESLSFQATIDGHGCLATEHRVLTVYLLQESHAQGVYERILTQAGEACQAFAGSALPERCVTLIHWQAHR